MGTLGVDTWGGFRGHLGTLGFRGHVGTLGNTWGGFRGHLETIGLGHGVGLGNLLHGIQTFRLTLGDTWGDLFILRQIIHQTNSR